MGTTLVAYATMRGSTRGVAERLASRLDAGGVAVTLVQLVDLTDVGAHRDLVLGSAIHSGEWLSDATHALVRIAPSRRADESGRSPSRPSVRRARSCLAHCRGTSHVAGRNRPTSYGCGTARPPSSITGTSPGSSHPETGPVSGASHFESWADGTGTDATGRTSIGGPIPSGGSAGTRPSSGDIHELATLDTCVSLSAPQLGGRQGARGPYGPRRGPTGCRRRTARGASVRPDRIVRRRSRAAADRVWPQHDRAPSRGGVAATTRSTDDPSAGSVAVDRGGTRVGEWNSSRVTS